MIHRTIRHLDGRLFATAGFIGPDSPWPWISETIAHELGCDVEAVRSIETDDGDMVTVDGLPLYSVDSKPGA